jgi:RHS repeat-associated protein
MRTTAPQSYNQTDGVRQKYAGMEKDDASAMAHTLWRKYDSSSGRWTTPDPYGGSMTVADPQSFNRYTYVNNDPVNQVDPTGLMAEAQTGWSGVSDGFWGSSFDFNASHFGGPGIISAADAHRDELVQGRLDGILAQHYLDTGEYGAAQSILKANANVGLFAGGAPLWGELASEFITGASQPVEIAQRMGIPSGAVGIAVRRGLERVAGVVQKRRAPDFYLLSLAANVAEGSLAVTREGTFTVAFGASSGSEASLMAGWLLQLDRPPGSEITSFLTGRSLQGSLFWNPRTGAGAGVGGGFVRSPDNSGTRWGFLLGLGVGGGVSVTYGQTWEDLTGDFFPGQR